jgi:hypothetical protein
METMTYSNKSKLGQKNIADLWEKVKKAEEYHEKHYKKQAIRSTKLLRGDLSFVPEKMKSDSNSPNLFFSTIRNYLPALYLKNPEIYIKPRGPEWGDTLRDNYLASIILQNVINYYQDVLKMKQTDKLVILSSLIGGVGYAYSGWEASKKNGKIYRDRPLHKFVNGVDLYVDPAIVEFDDAEYVVRVFGASDFYMAQKGYKNIKKNQNTYTEDRMGRIELPKYYEIISKEYEKAVVLSQSEAKEGQFNGERDYDLEKCGFPITPLILNPSIDKYYPQSLGSVLESSQKVITLLSTFGIHHVKRAIPKIAAKVKYLSPKARRALLNGDDQALVEIVANGETKDKDIDSIIRPIAQAGLTSDFYNMLNMSRDFMNILSGVHEEARGGGLQATKTATEANILESFLRARMDDYRDIVRDYVKESREKIIQQIRKNSKKDQYLTFNKMDIEAIAISAAPEFAEKIKEKGPHFFVSWNQKDITDKYDIQIGVGSTLPLNKESEYKKALQNYSMMANDPFLEPVKVRKQFLNNIGVPDVENWVKPMQPPQQEPPEDPLKISLSINFEDLNNVEDLSPAQNLALQKAGIIPKPPPQAPPGGNPSAPGSGLQPLQGINQNAINESFVPGTQLPANMPETNG